MAINITWDWKLIVLIAIVLFFLIALFYIQYKRSRDLEKKPVADPLMRSVILGAVIIFIILIADFLGYVEVRKFWRWFFPLLILVIFWWNSWYLRRLKPLSYEKLLRKALDFIATELKFNAWHDVVYQGTGFQLPIVMYSETETRAGQMLSNFFIFTSRKFRVLIRLDSRDARTKFFMPVPKEELKNKILMEEIAKQYDLEREIIERGLRAEPEEKKEEEEGEEEKE